MQNSIILFEEYLDFSIKFIIMFVQSWLKSVKRLRLRNAPNKCGVRNIPFLWNADPSLNPWTRRSLVFTS